jgi:3-dehydroquinate synthetase
LLVVSKTQPDVGHLLHNFGHHFAWAIAQALAYGNAVKAGLVIDGHCIRFGVVVSASAL